MTDNWTHREALILGALAGTGAGSTAPLPSVIAIIDGWDDTYLTGDEFAAAAGRLVATGLIGSDGANFWLTETGAPIRRTRGRRVEKLLIGLRKVGEPYGDPLVLPEGAYEQAYVAYRADPERATEGRPRRRPRRVVDPTIPQWTYTDRLVFIAFGTTAGERRTLAEIVAGFDYFERAIILLSEFTVSAGRLIGAGLIDTDGTRYWLTEAGAQLRAARGHREERLLPGLRKLGPPTGKPLDVTQETLDRAIEEYLNLHKQ